METRNHQKHIRAMLRQLGIPVYRTGYILLCEAIPRYAADGTQRITKELYPEVAKTLGLPNALAVERPIRSVIQRAWRDRDAAAWQEYFPHQERAPSNLVFIATLADRLQ